MENSDTEILKRVEALHTRTHALAQKAVKADQQERAFYAAKYLHAIADSIIHNRPVFAIEPWHPLQDGLELSQAGEMLLRVQDANGDPMSPYAAVMTFYHNGFTEELDTLLCLCALRQFRQGTEKQVSINISCRSLQDPAFVKAVASRIEMMKLQRGEKIIMEIHESNSVVQISAPTAKLFKGLGVGFAMDDVGLSMNDVFRLSAFEDIADYIKLDRASVSAHPEDPRSLKHILALARSLLPRAQMVAEGIQNAEHAREILRTHPDIKYVQGMHLPDRETFLKEWKK